MATDKKIDYTIQDGYKNYIKNSDSITVPQKFQSRKNAAQTKLAYITDVEAKQLKKQNKGTPHKGPKGIPSYDSFDAKGNYTSGTAMSAMETGSKNARDRAEVRASNYGGPKGMAPGAKTKAEQEIRGGAQAAAAMGQRRSGIGGILGGLGRGIMSIFGGIPGRIIGGLSAAQNWAKRTGQNIGEEVDEFGQYPTLDRWLNRKTNKYKNKPYLGQGQSNYTFNNAAQGNDLGLLTNRVTPDYYNDLGNELALSTQADATGGTDLNDQQGVNFNNQNFDPNFYAGVKDGGRIGYQDGGGGGSYVDYVKAMNALDMEPIPIDIFDSLTGFMSMQEIMDMGSPSEDRAQGGRIGYQGGEFVDENINVEGPNFDVNENIEMAEGPNIDELIEARVQELMDEGLDWGAAMAQAKREFGMAEGEEESFSEEGIASVV